MQNVSSPVVNAVAYFEPPIDSKEAAEFLGIHHKTVEKYAREGRIPSHRLGSKCLRFYMSELDNRLRLCDNGNQPIRPCVN